jgi:membrane protease YdiL (CAAX protease family)
MTPHHNSEVSNLNQNVPNVGEYYWRPNKETLVAFISYALVVGGLYTAFQVFTPQRVAANFLTFGPLTLASLGVAVPVLYTVLVRRRSLTNIGVTTKHLIPSITLSIFLAWDTYRNTLAGLALPSSRALIPLVTMTLAVGLFEAVFFRGWLQMRFEEAFGLVPGLIVAAACYSLYHIGYGMEVQEMLFLFGLGLTFGAFFRLTKSIFVLWPLYTPIGSIYTNLSEGLVLPFDATYGFLITLILMFAIMFIGHRLSNRVQGND